MTLIFKLLTTIILLVLCVFKINASETLTQEQIKQETDKAINQSDVGLVSVTHADGTISRDLKGRFQNFSKVVVDENGNKHFICNMHPDIEHLNHNADGTPTKIQPKAVSK